MDMELPDPYPSPFKDLESYHQARLWVDHNLILSTNATIYPTLLANMPVSWRSFISDAYTARGAQERSAVLANMFDSILKKANPLYAQAFFLSKKFQTWAKKWMEENYPELQYESFLGKDAECRDPSLIAAYMKNVIAFRTAMGNEFGIITESPTLMGQVKARVQVPSDTDYGTLIAMLDDMNAKRNARLGNASANRKSVEEHTEMAINAFTGDISQMCSELIGKRRTKIGGGYELKLDEEGQGNFDVTAIANQGPLLLSTGLMTIRRTDPAFFQEIITKMRAIPLHHDLKDMFATIDYEVQKMVENEGAEGGIWASQHSNIDPLWLSSYIIYGILRLDVEEFIQLHRVLYAIGRRTRGAARIIEILLSHRHVPGTVPLYENMSESTKIFLPPWVVSAGRLQDICVSFAGFNMWLPITMKEGCASWRNFLSIKPECKGMLHFLTAAFDIEMLIHDKTPGSDISEDIFQSEKMFQQFIMGRSGALACTNLITGNALAVELVPSDEQHDDDESSHGPSSGDSDDDDKGRKKGRGKGKKGGGGRGKGTKSVGTKEQERGRKREKMVTAVFKVGRPSMQRLSEIATAAEKTDSTSSLGFTVSDQREITKKQVADGIMVARGALSVRPKIKGKGRGRGSAPPVGQSLLTLEGLQEREKRKKERDQIEKRKTTGEELLDNIMTRRTSPGGKGSRSSSKSSKHSDKVSLDVLEGRKTESEEEI